MYKILKIAICLFVLSGTVVGCKKDISQPYIKARVGEQEFCIPKDYFEFPHVQDEDGGFLIGAMYPDMKPARKITPEMVGRDIYFKNKINILAQPIVPLERPLPWVEMFPKSYELLEDKREYGLIPTKRKTGNHFYEMWLHPDAGLSDSFAVRVACSEGTKSKINFDNPQCSLFFPIENVIYQVDFSRTNFSEWAKIREKADTLIKNFNCKNIK